MLGISDVVTLDLSGMGIVIGSCIQEEEPDYSYRLRRVVYGEDSFRIPSILAGMQISHLRFSYSYLLLSLPYVPCRS